MSYLVLKRKVHQTITIGPDVEITVVKVNGKEVSLSIKAPRELRIHRKEKQTELTDESPQKKADS